jgi:protein-L-isoaspartate(D-aspartate) O-methyltransferase
VAVEGDSGLASVAEQTFKDLGIANIQQTVAKMEAGAPAEGPYGAILIEGAVQEIPRAILDQLAEGGRLTTVMAAPAGVLGVAQLVLKEGGVTSGRPLFDAGTPALPGFARPARFTF